MATPRAVLNLRRGLTVLVLAWLATHPRPNQKAGPIPETRGLPPQRKCCHHAIHTFLGGKTAKP